MRKGTEITIKEIFEYLRKGNVREGVELLYRNHYNKMYGVAFSIVKKEDISQDIVHNVIRKLLKMESGFPVANELTWLYTVVKNESLMFLRNKIPAVCLDEATLPIIEDKDIRDYVDMDAYYSMIEGLNEKQKTVVTLKVLGGYTHREIADILGVPIGTIQWIYNTSVKKLRVLLSSILVVVVVSSVGFLVRLLNYIEALNSYSYVPGDFTQSIEVPVFDGLILIFGLLAVLSATAFVIIYIKSYKLPTKSDKKSI